MKSKQEQLISRGFLIKGIEYKYFGLLFNERNKLLESKIPTDRTLGARLLADSKEDKTVKHLINALKLEKKLYPKLEICNSLKSCGQLSIIPLIEILGIVGTNQHKKVPDKEFKKESYPLPRDISARTLAYIGKKALPELVEVLKTGNEEQLSEAIDAVGHICFYDYTAEVYKKLQECFSLYNKNDLIRWKIIQAMSGIPESKFFLSEQRQKINNSRLLKEIDRSLLLINKKIKPD